MGFAAMTTPIQAILRAASASTPIFEAIDRKPVIDALSPEGLCPDTLPMGDLELRNIKFSYPETGQREEITILGGSSSQLGTEAGKNNPQSEKAEVGLSLSFPTGKTTAIVGRSGSGKSTIVALLERWYDPQQGNILIGGVDIKDLNLRWWRSQIGLVMQEPYLFKGTIYFNVLKGLTGTEWEGESEEVKRRLVIEACTQANAAGFIHKLPEVSLFSLFVYLFDLKIFLIFV
jgi:ATP-binding cassette subfamily B (MDR/TAP) protein 1